MARWPFCVQALEQLVFSASCGAGIYATIIVNRLSQPGSRATPPHRQNLLDVALLTSDVESETPNYRGEGGLCQAQIKETQPQFPSQPHRWASRFFEAGRPRKLEDPLHEIPNPDREAAEQENQEETCTEYGYFEFSISAFVGGRQRTLREIGWWCGCSHDVFPFELLLLCQRLIRSKFL